MPEAKLNVVIDSSKAKGRGATSNSGNERHSKPRQDATIAGMRKMEGRPRNATPK